MEEALAGCGAGRGAAGATAQKLFEGDEDDFSCYSLSVCVFGLCVFGCCDILFGIAGHVGELFRQEDERRPFELEDKLQDCHLI